MFNKVLSFPNSVGEWPTSGLMMLANSLGTPYVIAPLLEEGA